ncbi:hypothetical protein K488DRAFT_57276 [Vararia minispora EC-137]|uniref:Uncharacterized protein n=1 Tax=Vararia minispora EC-137 TaxID=1314806 RepID=A0ACB8QBQ1_9AGAM|nr:hypothetical protein K488DRAFT_57276 [Vararia minispora EC-137]
MSTSNFPLTPFEVKGRDHAHIAFFAFFVGLPLGAGAARYLRTFTNGWVLPHMLINGLVVGPLVIAAFTLGYQTTTMSGVPHFSDPHQKVGLALFIMYWIQLALGAFIHWTKIPASFPGGRRPQNYLHITLGLAILVLASWQTHYGLYTEWAFATGNLHPVSSGCKHFWLAILIVRTTPTPTLKTRADTPADRLDAVPRWSGRAAHGVMQIVWGLYVLGLLWLPRQIKQERAAREPKLLAVASKEGA